MSSKPHTTTNVETSKVDTIKNEPLELKSNNRLYTTSDQRRRLGIDTEYGRGTKVRVRLRTVDRDTEWNNSGSQLGVTHGQYEQNGFFSTDIRYYGAIRIPEALVQRMGLTEGDNIRTDVTVIRRPNEYTNQYS